MRFPLIACWWFMKSAPRSGCYEEGPPHGSQEVEAPIVGVQNRRINRTDRERPFHITQQ
jgi:hypothetical protein